MVVVYATVKFEFKPVVSVASGKTFRHSCSLRRVLDKLFGRAVIIIFHAVGVSQICKCAYIPVSSCVDSHVIHQVSVGVPVAIDVLWLCGSSAGSGIVCHHVADAVAGGACTQIGVNGTLMRLYIIVIEHAETVSKRRLQSWITFRYVQRVGVICDVKQVGRSEEHTSELQSP